MPSDHMHAFLNHSGMTKKWTEGLQDDFDSYVEIQIKATALKELFLYQQQ